MFSDRLWIPKAAAALGLFALLCTVSQRKLVELHPDVERVALFNESLRNQSFHLAAKKVRGSDTAGFEIATRVGPMRVLTSTPPPVGEYVTVNARAVGPRTLQATELEVLDGYAWKRPLNYAVSILTLIGFLWLVRKRFTWHPQAGLFRGKY